ncbi:MAG: phosphoribosylformylglycinamidine cyclo-ligase [Nitriliruptoraceae bacterium]
MTASAGPGDPVSYADAGVDVDAADRAVRGIAQQAARTRRPEVLDGIGGFGGLFAARFDGLRDPVLVSGTDGVGTKVEIARRMGVYDTIGRDLVAMVVDDLVVTGAAPLFFNDYIVVGRLDEARVVDLVAGIADGCLEAGCALVGGETAEHPDLLEADAFDLAGFGVGVVDRERLLGAHRVQPGDVLLAIESSGLHSNGYSLVRRIVGDRALEDRHGLDRPLGEELLEPTRIHTADCLALIEAMDVHALCHVTGGGIPGNLPRVLPEGVVADVDRDTWRWPAIFAWLQAHGPVTEREMWRTFNCGVGMIAVLGRDDADRAVELLAGRGVRAWPLGAIRPAASTDVAPTVAFVGSAVDEA